MTGVDVPTDPGDRRIERRDTARVLLIDPVGRVLLFEDSDPGLPGRPTFWITPGGGIDPGETPAEAAAREVTEETGYVVPDGLLTGPVARRTVVHGYSDKIVEQTETFFVARVPEFAVDTAGHTVDEVETLVAHRWWSRDELVRTDATVWPLGLPQLLGAVLGGAPWPVALDGGEESTVPA